MSNPITTHIAKLELQKHQLANGNTVYTDSNLTPTPDWNCKQVGTPQSYNWAMLETEAQFNLRGPMGLFAKNAIDYANQQNLNPNYINLYVPSTWGYTTGNARVTNTVNLTPNRQAVATFYQCQYINPKNKLGIIKGQGKISVQVGNGSAPDLDPDF